jgi:hypothetical protein
MRWRLPVISPGSDLANLLAPIRGWFTGGFGTPGLKVVKALIDELP